MESEYISVCTVLGLKCYQKLNRHWQFRNESRKPMDVSKKKKLIQLAEDEFVDYSGRVQQYLLN